MACYLHVHVSCHFDISTRKFNTLRPRPDWWPTFCRIHTRMHFSEWKLFDLGKLSRKGCKGSINNNPALGQVMVWCWTSDKPLFKRMMAYERIYASVGFNRLINGLDSTFKWNITSGIKHFMLETHLPIWCFWITLLRHNTRTLVNFGIR